HLGVNTHWVLWRKMYDDNWGRWNKPIAIARYVWEDHDWHGAAMILLAQLFVEEIRYYSSDPGRFGVNNTGLLSMEETRRRGECCMGKHERVAAAPEEDAMAAEGRIIPLSDLGFLRTAGAGSVRTLCLPQRQYPFSLGGGRRSAERLLPALLLACRRLSS